MRADDLTADQADNLNLEIHRMASRIYDLMRRMQELKFEQDDKLFVAIQIAQKSLKALSDETFETRTRLRRRLNVQR